MLKIYGYSDDLIEIEGQTEDEIYCYDTTLRITFLDGTVVEFSYGKPEGAIWNCNLISQGKYFDKIEYCTDENAEIYSDILYMMDSQECLIGSFEEI